MTIFHPFNVFMCLLGASIPVAPLLSVSGDRIAEQVGCPTLNGTSTQVGQGFGCSEGEVLRSGIHQTLPECCEPSYAAILLSSALLSIS